MHRVIAVDSAAPEQSLVVESDGSLTSEHLNRVGFSAKQSSTSVTSSFTTIQFATELEDTHNAFDGTLFTVPTGKGGMYSISGVLCFSSVTDGNIYIVGIGINSSSAITYILGRGTSGGTNLAGVGGNVQVPMNEGDVLRLFGYTGNETTCYSSNSGYCSFSAYRMID